MDPYENETFLYDNDLNNLVKANKKTGVLSGLEVTASSGLQVSISSGTYAINGTIYSYSGGTATIPSPDTTNPRKDIITIDAAGAVSITSGTPESLYPAGKTGRKTIRPSPPSADSSSVQLAEIWVEAGDSTISSSDITDMRQLIKTIDNSTLTESNGQISVGSIDASYISDFDTEVSNNTDVATNTSHRNTTSGNPHQVTLSELEDVDLSSPSNGQAIIYNGTKWENKDIATQDELDAHINDNTIHFTQAEINITHSQVFDWSTQFSTDFDSNLSSKTTDDLSEGTTNLYYTDARVSANSDVSANTSHRNTTSGNPHNVTKTDVGLSNVDNVQQIPLSEKGVANGVATLDSSGQVPSSQLPSYVDDVLEYDTLGDFPSTGESGKIYVAKDTNLTYRWSGSTYVEISKSLALGTTHTTAFYGDWGQDAYDHSNLTSGNPHNVKATEITDFDTEVSNNPDVSANTSARHSQNTDTGTSATEFYIDTGGDNVPVKSHILNTNNPHNVIASQVNTTDSGDYFNSTEVESTLQEIGEKDYTNGFDRNNANSLPDLSWDYSTRTLTVSPKSGQSSFHFWANRKKFTKTSSETITLPNTYGMYYIYYDETGTLQYKDYNTITDFHDYFHIYALVAFVIYNPNDAANSRAGNELHGIEMDGADHEQEHMTLGARYSSGFDIEGLAENSTTFTQITSGKFYDEDILHSNNSMSSVPTFYKQGADGDWYVGTASNEIGYKPSGNTYYVYNRYNSSTGEWELSEGDSSHDFYIIFFAQSPSLNGDGAIRFLSQNAYSTRGNARAAIESEITQLILDGLPSPEIVFTHALIIKRDGKLKSLSDGSLYLDLRTYKGGVGGASQASQYADDIITDTTNFNKLLSSADTDVQAALDTLDDHTHTHSDITDWSTQFSTDFDSNLSSKTTDDLSEGSSNLYYTEARVSANSSVVANTNHRNTTSGNPHNVTASDVGNTTAQWNANKIQDTEVDSTTPTNNQVLVYDSSISKWKPGAVSGVGDMLKSTYDTNDNGVVDDSEKLNGQAPSYYLDRSNHTGTQTASTISDFDTEVSNNTDVSANTSHRNTTSGNPHNVTKSDIGLNSTDDLSEGTTNLYYTESRVSANSDVSANTSHRNTTNGNPHNVISSEVSTDTTNFNNILSTSDSTIQKALDTLDDHTHTKSDITDFTESDYVHTTGDESIDGEKTFNEKTSTLIADSGNVSRQEVYRWGQSGQNTFSLFVYGGAEDLVQLAAWNHEQNIALITDDLSNIDSSNVKGIYIKSGGNVGIGTKSPSEKLDVNGNIAVSGTVDGRDIATDGSNLDSHIANTSNPHNVMATQITDFDTEVSNNSDVSANTSARHNQNTDTGTSASEFYIDTTGDNVPVKSHIQSTSNPHSVNASQVGAYTKSETDSLLNNKEDTSNKVSSFQSTPDDTHYPSEKLVKDSLDNKSDVGHTHTWNEVSKSGSKLCDIDTLDASQKEIQNAVIHKGTSFPSSPVTGQEFFRTDENKVYFYNGSSWQTMGSSTPEASVPTAAKLIEFNLNYDINGGSFDSDYWGRRYIGDYFCDSDGKHNFFASYCGNLSSPKLYGLFTEYDDFLTKDSNKWYFTCCDICTTPFHNIGIVNNTCICVATGNHYISGQISQGCTGICSKSIPSDKNYYALKINSFYLNGHGNGCVRANVYFGGTYLENSSITHSNSTCSKTDICYEFCKASTNCYDVYCNGVCKCQITMSNYDVCFNTWICAYGGEDNDPSASIISDFVVYGDSSTCVKSAMSLKTNCFQTYGEYIGFSYLANFDNFSTSIYDCSGSLQFTESESFVREFGSCCVYACVEGSAYGSAFGSSSGYLKGIGFMFLCD